MSLLKLSDEEKKKILEKHKEATKSHTEKKEEMKKGLQQPKKQENKKTSSLEVFSLFNCFVSKI
jgi:hypothetical protein